MAQNREPVSIQDEIRYKGRSFNGYFSQYEREDVEPMPTDGLPSKVWVSESYIEVTANADPQLGPGDEALARKLAESFCRHYALEVRDAPSSSGERDGQWVFYDLCWKAGW
ncbi:hypothetical protein KUV73_09360 [Mameliella alba]|nr:hypothetical protein [Mameliella alba]MBY6169552.1 hypothetical protein [Mameliella alba]MBY6174571.1 hypothetical protein [Mameliella alba]